MLNSNGFDLWANEYDKSVELSEEENKYPFAGYKKVLSAIYDTIKKGDGTRILDIGFGTAILSKRLYDEGYSISGIDFSARMIEIAQQKMPRAKLLQYDFTQGLPSALAGREFDYIISTYAIHHLNDSQKIEFLKDLLDHLSPDGMVLIGDVAFRTKEELNLCRTQSGDAWDEDEYYPVLEALTSALPHVAFEQLSFCAGVFQLTK